MMRKLAFLVCGAVLLGLVSCNSKEAQSNVDPLLGSWASPSSGIELVFYPTGIYVVARQEIIETGQFWRSGRNALKFLPRDSEVTKAASYTLSGDNNVLTLNGGDFPNSEFIRIDGGYEGQ